MKTLLFCTSYIADKASWDARYSRWLDHHRQSPIAPHAIAMIDDGSPYLPDHLPVVSASALAKTVLPAESIVHFSQRLGRLRTMDFPGWWRGLFGALALARHYGFERIVHVESDSFILSDRLASFLATRTTGWTCLWLPEFESPESAVQVICRDAFHLLESLVEKGPFGFRDKPAENELGFTHVERGFVGNRYHEFNQPIPADADYCVQTRPMTVLPALHQSGTAYPAAMPPLQLALADPATTASFEHAASDPGLRQQLQNVYQSYPFDAETSCRYGIALYLGGDSSSGRKALERANWLRPDHALTCKFLAASRMQTQEVHGAASAAANGVALQPGDAELLNMAGAFHLQSGQIVPAIEYFAASLALNPENTGALSNLALVDWSTAEVSSCYPEGFQGFQESVRLALVKKLKMNRLTLDGAKTLFGFGVHHPADFDALLQLATALAKEDNADAQTLFICGNAFSIAGNRDASLLAYQRALSLKPDSFRIENAVGYALIATGSGFREGFRIVSETWPTMNPPAFVGSPPRWLGDAKPGEKLLVYQEQGIGDALLCLRFIPLLKRRSIDATLWLRPELASLVLDQAGIPLARVSIRPAPASIGADHVTPLFGLIEALDIDVGTLPAPLYIEAPFTEVEHFKALIDSPGSLKVGLCLYGNPGRADDWLRSVPLSEAQPLALLENILWVNLSVDKRPELAHLKKMLPAMIDLTAQLTDFAASAALIANLDVVVAIDSAVAHLAAALGKKVLLLAPTVVDWRWKIADQLSPWWPSVEVFASDQPGSFSEAIPAVAERLEGLLRLEPRGNSI